MNNDRLPHRAGHLVDPVRLNVAQLRLVIRRKLVVIDPLQVPLPKREEVDAPAAGREGRDLGVSRRLEVPEAAQVEVVPVEVEGGQVLPVVLVQEGLVRPLRALEKGWAVDIFCRTRGVSSVIILCANHLLCWLAPRSPACTFL